MQAWTRWAALAAGLAITTASLTAHADVTVGYQTGADPSKVAIADGRYQQALGEKVHWKRFATGPAIIAALASGSIDIDYVGSTPTASAISQGLPIKVFLVNTLNNSNEELVARDGSGVDAPASLKGKTIATPFVSTSHYSLLNALAHWQISRRDVKLVNLDPAGIAAAWKRGDIDAAFTWDPALSAIKQSGKVLTSAGEVGKWGAPTFDVWVTLDRYAQAHPDALKKFSATTLQAFDDYAQHQREWTADSAPVKAVAKLTGANPADIPAQLQGGVYPDAKAQRSDKLLGGGLAEALKSTAQFLYQQHSIPAVKEDYRPYVTANYVPNTAP
ncbi:taurine ABC transporter substrate-binding protein [Carnimonas bestiolae]|uniref:taurine ABC transporter substrate-binding protein n=1 Tax=Carnimonas bestiolae TaxID=3402172 RepID=UPI003EDC8568